MCSRTAKSKGLLLVKQSNLQGAPTDDIFFKMWENRFSRLEIVKPLLWQGYYQHLFSINVRNKMILGNLFHQIDTNIFSGPYTILYNHNSQCNTTFSGCGKHHVRIEIK